MTDPEKRRVSRSKGRGYKLTVMLSEEELADLVSYCERENLTQAEAIRRAIRDMRGS
jgi:hypothetical protein